MSKHTARTVLAIAVLTAVAHLRVRLAPGCTVTVGVLALAAGAVVLAALTALAAWTVRDFRSPPPWRPVATAGGAR